MTLLPCLPGWRARRLLLAACVLLGLAACGAAPLNPAAGAPAVNPAPAAVLPATLPRFSFAAGDEFDLRVPDAPQFDQTLKVRPDGKVSLPLLGTVHVQGRTPEDVQEELRERFKQLAGAPGEREYLLRAGDEIELKFPYHSQLNELLRLRPDGKIQVQMVGTLQAEGLSPEELQLELKRRYARHLKVPELSVMVRNVTSQNVRVAGGTGRAGLAGLQPSIIARGFQPAQVFVGGEVGRPGVLAYRPGLSLLQALIESGGQLPTGDAHQLMVLRRGADDQMQVLRPDLPGDYLRAPDRDLALQPYDVVLLPKSDAATLADRLNQYLFNLFPPLKNSSLGFSYVLRGDRTTP
jgi:protein involved in polysaccharide export with SLBB domain